MGYWISKLKNLPTTLNWYFFLVGEYRNHSMINDFFRDDFCVLAEFMDEDSALIAKNRHLEADLQSALKDINHGELGKMMAGLERGTPGLFITNKHPRLLNNFNVLYEEAKRNMPATWSEQEKSDYMIEFYNKNRGKSELANDARIVYIPFKTLEKAYDNTSDLMFDITDFCKGINDNLIKKTSKIGTLADRISTSFSLNLGIVAINFDLEK